MDSKSSPSEASAVTVQLPKTEDNPSGRYYQLQSDDTLAAEPITSISLRNTDGAVLVKESRRPRVEVSCGPDDRAPTRLPMRAVRWTA